MKETIRRRTANTIWMYYAFVFFTSMHFFGSVLVPFLTDYGGLTQTEVQLLQSWFMVWIFILEVPTGVIADYFGRKQSLVLGAIMYFIGILVYSSAPGLGVFMAGEFIFAIGVALTSGANTALLYDALKEANMEDKSTKVFGKAHAWRLTGFFVSGLLGSVIAANFGLVAPMKASLIPTVIAIVIGLYIREPKIRSNQSEQTRYLDLAKDGFMFFYKHKELRLLALDAVLVASAGYFVIWLYQPLLRAEGFPILYFGLVHGGLTLAQIIICHSFEWLEKAVGSWRGYAVFSALMTAGAFIVVSVFPNVVTIILFTLIAGGFGLTRIEFLSAHINKLIPSDKRATVLSSISMFQRLALVLINPFVGFMFDVSVGVALILVALLPLMSAGLVPWIRAWRQPS